MDQSSSTSSSSAMKQSPYLVLVKGLAFGLASLVLLEILLRIPLVRKFLPLPSPYYNTSIMLREDVLRQYRAKYGDPKVLFMGSSISRADPNIGLFQQLTGKNTFGLGMSAMSPGRTEVYWQHFWKTRLAKPDMVLHFVRTTDFTEKYDPADDSELSKGRIERDWLANPSGGETLNERLLSFRLAQYYGCLSKAIAGDRHPFFSDPFVTDIFGCKSEPDSILLSNPGFVRSSHHEGKYGPFSAMMSRSNSFQILRRLQNEVGGEYVLVYCPEYIEAWESPAELADWWKSLKSLCERAGFMFVDPTSLDPSFVSDPSNYHDFIHYDQKGAERFTRLLVQALGDISH